MLFRKLLWACVLTAAAGGAQASCDDLKAKIEAKFQAKGVTGYRLDAVRTGSAASGKVVGICDGGSRQIVYSRGAASAAPRPAAKAVGPATAPAARPQVRKNRPPPALGNY